MSVVEEIPTKEKRFTWREPLAVLAAIVLVDTTVYHGNGFAAGLALLVFVLPLLFLFGVAKPLLNGQTLLFAGLACLVSLKLIWSGNETVALIGLGTVFLFAALQARIPLYLTDLGRYSVHWFHSTPLNLSDYYQSLRRWKTTSWTLEPAKQAAVFVPIALLLVFGTIFVFANPDLQEKLQSCWNAFIEWVGHFSNWVPVPSQVLLWGLTIWIMIGLLRPREIQRNRDFEKPFSAEWVQKPDGIFEYVQKQFETNSDKAPSNNEQNLVPQNETVSEIPENQGKKSRSVYYYTYFNSLVSLSLLFGIYLIFEFYRNWTLDFPPKFNYSQHMHNGAAYLTLALALSTLVLCTIFHGKTLLDPRIKMLKRLAVIWTVLNFLLAFAVYNRLYIYIDLNGLSRLRITGILGTTAVVLGLIMVVRMILLSKGIRWLLYRYTWSVLAVVFIGYVFPFDWYVSHHNVSRVMKGDLAPSVFLFPVPLNEPEHYLASLPLLESEDEIIREGAQAFFASYYSSQKLDNFSRGYQWTAFQWSRNILKNTLEPRKEEFQTHLNNSTRKKEAMEAFRKYTNRWI